MSSKNTRESKMSVEEALLRRRSVRAFTRAELSEALVLKLLFAAQGVTEPRFGFRTAPSPGALYSLETYVFTRQGVFHYLPGEHAVELTREGDLRALLAESALGQRWVREAPATVVFTSVGARIVGKYGKGSERMGLIEVGHAAQNVHLQAVALGLGSVPVAAFDPRGVATLIGCSTAERPIYLVPVGYPA